MPKFYCEYCGIYLTHSSPSGRGQHAKGRKHINNRIEYYKQVIEDVNKENQDKMRQMQQVVQIQNVGQPLAFPQMQNQHQMMLMQLQHLSAGGISQMQINSKNGQQAGPGNGAPMQGSIPQMGIGMPPNAGPGAAPLRQGGMHLPPHNMMGMPPGMQLPQGMMMPPPGFPGIPPMGFLPPHGFEQPNPADLPLKEAPAQ